MIWLYIFLPVIILGGIAIYFEKKSGATPPDVSTLTNKIEEYPPENSNSHGPSNFGP
jgi:hypothetical protein